MAWYRYFNSTLTSAGLTNGTEFSIAYQCFTPTLLTRHSNYYTFSFTIYHVKVLDHTKGTVKMVIGSWESKEA